MRSPLIEAAEQAYRKADTPVFRIGDNVTVSVQIVEGEKERVQNFSGVVIARRGQGITEMFTVRRIVNNEGVERLFPLHSPKILGVEVTRSGKVRRAKLFFLRHRVGKARKLRERRVSRSASGSSSGGKSLGTSASANDQQARELAKV